MRFLFISIILSSFCVLSFSTGCMAMVKIEKFITINIAEEEDESDQDHLDGNKVCNSLLSKTFLKSNKKDLFFCLYTSKKLPSFVSQGPSQPPEYT